MIRKCDLAGPDSVVIIGAGMAGLSAAVLPGIYGYHPDFAKIDWAKTEWKKNGKPWTPDPAKSLAENGLALLNHGLWLDDRPLRPAMVEWINDGGHFQLTNRGLQCFSKRPKWLYNDESNHDYTTTDGLKHQFESNECKLLRWQ